MAPCIPPVPPGRFMTEQPLTRRDVTNECNMGVGRKHVTGVSARSTPRSVEVDGITPRGLLASCFADMPATSTFIFTM
eukprot:692863-Rhodomonas_salina.1